MDQIITTVTNWPVIVQGALGSALFATLFFLGKVLSKKILNLFEKITNRREEHAQHLYKIRSLAANSKTPERKSQWMNLLVYLVLGQVIRAFIWFIFGSISSSIIPVFGIIGYLGALYYLFNALTAYKNIASEMEGEET